MRGATNDTTAEIGALLLLLGLSVSIGGVIERSQIMQSFPQSFDSAFVELDGRLHLLTISATFLT
ncbi:hypothetical protein [Marinobacter antarcticus]|uniref:hypothetical protein n=1 Tax=Marinobacter antarcticus TaxID=564117 RepID=UPI000934DA1E|nr:hypothetical protein [Marinobacter antarcticus]